jgi:hypothetical protein
VLVVVLALATPVGAAVHNTFFPSVFSSRNMISSWPGLALSVAALLTAGQRWVSWLATGSLVAGLGIGGLKMLEQDSQRPGHLAAAHLIEDHGPPNAPVVESPLLSPGPQFPMEVALAPKGDAVPPDRPVYELARPTIQTRLADRRRGGVGLYPPLPVQPADQIAHRAAAVAGNGPLFLVVPGAGTLSELRGQLSSAGGFLGNLLPTFHEVDSRTFQGFFPISVYVLRSGGKSRP